MQPGLPRHPQNCYRCWATEFVLTNTPPTFKLVAMKANSSLLFRDMMMSMMDMCYRAWAAKGLC